MNKRHAGGVLLVEDDDGLREILAIALRRSGFRVRTAADEKHALEAFFEHAPAAVVIDLILPAGEGLNTVRAMREAEPGAPIVVMSGGGFFASEELCGVARSLGADAALCKPFGTGELVERLSGLLAPPLAELAA